MERIETVVKKEKKKSNKLFAEWSAKIKSIKNIEYIIGAVFIGILLLIVFSGNIFSSKQKTESTVSFTLEEYAAVMENKMSTVLSSIQGAGKVKVMITYESGIEIITASVINKQSNEVKDKYSGGDRSTKSETESNSPVMIGGKPVILKEMQPKVMGVIIISEGADSVRVKIELQKAVSTLLDVKQDKIEIFTMQKGK